MPTTYLESFGADLSENELFQCVSILLTGTSTEIGSTTLYAYKLVSQPRENLKMWITYKENIYLELKRVDEVKHNIKM